MGKEQPKQIDPNILVLGRSSYDVETILWAASHDTWGRLRGPIVTDQLLQQGALAWARTRKELEKVRRRRPTSPAIGSAVHDR